MKIASVRKYLSHYLFSIIIMLSLSLAPTMIASAKSNTNPPQPEAITAKALYSKLIAAGSNAKAVFAEMSPEQKNLVKKYLTVVAYKKTSSSVVTEVTNAATVCGSFTNTIAGVNKYGAAIFTYNQRLYRCYNGSTVTNISGTRWSEVYFNNWTCSQYATSSSGGNGQASYNYWGKAKCTSKDIFGTIIQTAYPWVDQTIYGNGTLSETQGLLL